MIRPTLLPRMALSAALVLACGDQVAPTSSSEPLDASASEVLRTPAAIGDFLVDESANLSLLIGGTYERLVEVCNAGGGPLFDPATLLLVGRPDGSLKLHLTAKDANVIVFEGVLAPGDCEAFLSTTPLAEGTVNASQADNDFFVSGERTNSFHLHLTGRGVYTATGEPVHISAKLRGLVHKDFTGPFSVEIRLK